MFNGNLKQLFIAMVLEAVANELVPLLPKPRISQRYPRASEGERVRRMGQILCGIHRVQNGLARDGQLVSRPDGSIQVRRPY